MAVGIQINNIEPFDWLKNNLTILPDYPTNKLLKLCPCNNRTIVILQKLSVSEGIHCKNHRNHGVDHGYWISPRNSTLNVMMY
jgi:hypothetical protein